MAWVQQGRGSYWVADKAPPAPAPPPPSVTRGHVVPPPAPVPLPALAPNLASRGAGSGTPAPPPSSVVPQTVAPGTAVAAPPPAILRPIGSAIPPAVTPPHEPPAIIGQTQVPYVPASVAPFSTWSPGGDLSNRFDSAFPNAFQIQPASSVANPNDPIRMPDAAAMDAWRTGVNQDMLSGAANSPYSTGTMYDWQSPLPFATSGSGSAGTAGSTLGGLSGTPVNNPSAGNSSFGSPFTNLNSNNSGMAATAQGALQPGGQAAQGIQAGSWADWFYRGVVIILGFIFVAVGIGMFKSTQTLIANVAGVAGGLKGVAK